MKSINSNPYYDDFDAEKNFYQVLFKPGMAVQARELTQLQTILRDQIEKFGNHIFKHGSVVIPGNSFSEIGVPYLKVEPSYLGAPLNLALFEGKIVIGETSGVKAYIKKAEAANLTDPVTFYLSYLSGGTTGGIPNGKLVFDDGERIYLELMIDVKATASISDSTGFGSMASVNEGVYYVNGTFVSVQKQSVVISKYNTSPSCHVLLQIVEEIIDTSSDESLFDPADGSDNFAAPGADRLKISLKLITLPSGATITEDFVELMRYNDGVLEEHSRYPKYSELEKSLAARTFDESGNYVVNGFGVKVREHARISNNDGVFVGGDESKLVYELSAGKSYVEGFAVETISTRRLAVDKARTSAHVLQTSTIMKPEYGQYFLISNPQGNLQIENRETVNLYNISASSGGTLIGTAKVLAMDYLTGDGVNPVFKLYVSEIVLTIGTYEDIGSVRTATPFYAQVVAECFAPLTSGSFAVNDVVTFDTTTRTGTVAFYNSPEGKLYLHKHIAGTAVPKSGDTIVGPTATTTIQSKSMIVSVGQSGCVFRLPKEATKSLKDSLNAYDFEYTSYRKLNIGAGATTSATVSGTILPIEVGNFIAISSTGIDPISNYSINGTGNAIVRGSAAPVGGVVLYVQVNTDNGTPRTKTISSSSPIVKTSAAKITLNHADVFEIISVLHSGIDITNYYSLDPGQTDYEYGLSVLILKNGISLPVGNVTVTYRYFNHTAGDFFSVDSYLGTNPDDIPVYTSPLSGSQFNLRDCLDFRKTVSMSSSNLVVVDSIMNTSVQRYLPRIDSICLDKSGASTVITGTPSDIPKAPTIPRGVLELSQVFLPAYTSNVKTIKQKRIAPDVQTMQDVVDLKDRVSRLEEFSTLTASESLLIRTPVIDAESGLDRYKTGYLVEDMLNPFEGADNYRSEFKAMLSAENGIEPLQEVSAVQMYLSSGATGEYALTGGLLSLPYTEKVFASVNTSTRVTNINPFLSIAWNGIVYLNPPSDIWVETLDLPDVIKQIEQVRTVTVVVWVDPPVPTPAPAPAPSITPPGNDFVIGPTPFEPSWTVGRTDELIVLNQN